MVAILDYQNWPIFELKQDPGQRLVPQNLAQIGKELATLEHLCCKMQMTYFVCRAEVKAQSGFNMNRVNHCDALVWLETTKVEITETGSAMAAILD